VLDAPLLDRLIRGRVWIGLVAFALLGIVAMQVAILRLGASIGQSVNQIQQLTASNEAATTAIAEDEPGRNVATEAASLGMVYPPAGNIVYRRYSPSLAAVAAHSYTLPTAPLLTPAAPSLTTPIEPAVSTGATGADGTTTTAGATTTTTTPATSTSGATGATGLATTTTDTTSTDTTTPTDTTTTTTTDGAGGGSAAPNVGATG
jgi:hypothetical protein